MFIVPKFIVNDDGSLGERTKLSVSRSKKTRIHASPTCVMEYGGMKGRGTVTWLVKKIEV